MLPLVIRKRTITEADVRQIQDTINEHPEKNRTQISKILCHKWQYYQPNGRLKDMACREILLTLERKGFITLPPSRTAGNNNKRNKHIPKVIIDQTSIEVPLSALPPLELKMVRGSDAEPLYNSLIQHYHYLGYCQIIGNHLKYIAYIDNRPVACLGWGSAAWSVKSRDDFIGWDRKTKEQCLHHVANNTRFLILPWVKVRHLASKILALNARAISSDWMRVYYYRLYLLETFVEQSRFKGTCYKAANWIRVGETKGISKSGHLHLAHGNIKDVLLYPLEKDFRIKLTNEQV